MHEPGSYGEYLERVQAQGQRDRDRFVGADSHAAEPVYDARDGSLAMGTPPAFDADQFVAQVGAVLGPAWRQVEVAMSGLMETFTLVFEQVIEQEVLKGVGSDEFIGVRNARPPQHTYPRPRREWWVRR